MLKLGTEHFLPAVNTQERRKKESAMQICAGSHFMRLLFACPSGCQRKTSYKTVGCLRVQSFPGKDDNENLSLLQCFIQQFVFLYFLIGTSTGASIGYFSKRWRWARFTAKPQAMLQAALTLNRMMPQSYLCSVFSLSSIFLFYRNSHRTQMKYQRLSLGFLWLPVKFQGQILPVCLQFFGCLCVVT